MNSDTPNAPGETVLDFESGNGRQIIIIIVCFSYLVRVRIGPARLCPIFFSLL